MNNKNEKGKSLIKNIGWFVLASFVPRTITFFLVPLYTHSLTTQEYGMVDLIATTVQLLLPILTIQIQDAVLRFSLDKSYEPAQVFSVGLNMIVKGNCILLIGAAFAFGTGIVQLDWPYALFFIISFFIGSVNNIITYFLRAIDKVKVVSFAAIVNCLMTVSANLFFLLVLRWGVNGYLLANTIGHTVSVVVLVVAGGIRKYILFEKPKQNVMKEMIAFSIPMVVGSLAWWVNHSLDKYILTFFCGISASGMLAVAYKIPTIISTFGGIVSKSFSISVVQNFDPEDKDGFLGQSFAVDSFLMVLCTSGLMVLNVPLARLLFANDFFGAWKIVPPLLISALMNHLSANWEHVCVAMNRTRVISTTALVGATINTVLNLCLIPSLEGYGAAVATVISFGTVWFIRYVWVRKHTNLKNFRVKEPVSYSLLVLQMIFAYWGNQFLLQQVCVTLFLLILYKKEIMKVVKMVKNRFLKYRGGLSC